MTPPSGHVPLPMFKPGSGGRVLSVLSQNVPYAPFSTAAVGVAGSARFVAPNCANEDTAVITSRRRHRFADAWEPICVVIVGTNVGLFARK